MWLILANNMQQVKGIGLCGIIGESFSFFSQNVTISALVIFLNFDNIK